MPEDFWRKRRERRSERERQVKEEAAHDKAVDAWIERMEAFRKAQNKKKKRRHSRSR